MVRRALLGGALAAPLAFAAGFAVDGGPGAWSAVLGVAVIVANFAAHGLSLAWAAGVSIPVLQVVALGGFALRMGLILVALVLIDRTTALSTEVFGITAILGTLGLLVLEARLALRGLGGTLQIPPEPAAATAAEELRAREASP
jgi:hypothetical protein